VVSHERSAGVLQNRTLWTAGIAAFLMLLLLIGGEFQYWRLDASLNRQTTLATAAAAERDRLLQLVNEETGVRGYVATGDATFLQIYNGSLPRDLDDERTVTTALAGFANLRRAAARSRLRAKRIHDYFRTELALMRSGNLMRARAELKHGKALFDRFRSADSAGEAQIDYELNWQRKFTRLTVHGGFIAGLILCAALLLFAFVFVLLLRRAKVYLNTSLVDSLTGVGNRREAKRTIESLIRMPQSEPFGLVFIDLDGFKKINDAYGHAAGDAILREVGARLRAELRDGDKVCRLGGDEFICAIAPVGGSEDLRLIASRLHKAIGRPYKHEDDYYVIGCSVGVSLYPEHGTNADALLQGADRAMYDAKAGGGGVREALA
jgi:diguanylate cyclase (GGDEF)-like protein